MPILVGRFTSLNVVAILGQSLPGAVLLERVAGGQWKHEAVRSLDSTRMISARLQRRVGCLYGVCDF